MSQMREGPPPKPTATGPRTGLPWFLRMPLKWALFLAITFFVCFPYPSQFARHVLHLSDLEAMVEPDAPELAAMETELRARLEKKRGVGAQRKGQPRAEANAPWHERFSPRQVQKEVQRFVYDKVTYGWDWDVWGSADYMPTIGEMFERAEKYANGQLVEDCDGRAVVAASLMRRLGYNSKIVTDLRHVWVTTAAGEWMGPGRKKTIRSTQKGNEIEWGTAAGNVAVSFAYGVAVFPLWREAIILLAALVLMTHRRMKASRVAFGVLLMVQGLLFFRLGYLSPIRPGNDAAAWPAWMGLVHTLCGVGVLLVSSWRARRTASNDN